MSAEGVLHYQDLARACRLASAVSARDTPGVQAVFAEASASGRMQHLALAAAIRLVQVATELHSDGQGYLDDIAFDAITMTQRETEGQ